MLHMCACIFSVTKNKMYLPSWWSVLNKQEAYCMCMLSHCASILRGVSVLGRCPAEFSGFLEKKCVGVEIRGKVCEECGCVCVCVVFFFFLLLFGLKQKIVCRLLQPKSLCRVSFQFLSQSFSCLQNVQLLVLGSAVVYMDAYVFRASGL